MERARKHLRVAHHEREDVANSLLTHRRTPLRAGDHLGSAGAVEREHLGALLAGSERDDVWDRGECWPCSEHTRRGGGMRCRDGCRLPEERTCEHL